MGHFLKRKRIICNGGQIAECRVKKLAISQHSLLGKEKNKGDSRIKILLKNEKRKKVFSVLFFIYFNGNHKSRVIVINSIIDCQITFFFFFINVCSGTRGKSTRLRS